jgi:hypothetical protein
VPSAHFLAQRQQRGWKRIGLAATRHIRVAEKDTLNKSGAGSRQADDENRRSRTGAARAPREPGLFVRRRDSRHCLHVIAHIVAQMPPMERRRFANI